MPDFLAGQTLGALHFPVTVTDAEPDLFTFNATTYGIDADSGTYNDCGVAFTAPTTGRVLIHYDGQLSNDTAGAATFCSPVVRTGSTVGSGTTVTAASDDEALRNTGTSAVAAGRLLMVSALTPGSSYNVRLEHRVQSNIGSLARRRVTVTPAT